MSPTAGDVIAAQPDRPGRRAEHSAEDVDQRRLARPVGADDAEQLTGPDVEGDVIEDLGATDLPADGLPADPVTGVVT